MKGKKRKVKKRLGKYTAIAVLFLSIVICGTVAFKQIGLYKQSSANVAEINELKKEKAELEKEKKDIKEYKSYVKTDEYTEEVAREKLGLVHKGEIVFEPEEVN